MQTFLPYSDFYKSLDTLDKVRLNKQRVETFQLIGAIDNPNRWCVHPAFKMWIGYRPALELYANKCIELSDKWGINHSCQKFDVSSDVEMPHWLGNDLIHTSHQSNLVRKFPNHYNDLFPHLTPHMPYFWPVEIKCKKTGRFDEASGLWVKLNTIGQHEWYKNYLKAI